MEIKSRLFSKQIPLRQHGRSSLAYTHFIGNYLYSSRVVIRICFPFEYVSIILYHSYCYKSVVAKIIRILFATTLL